MGAAIIDEFAMLDISKQQRWQMRKRRDGKCVICGAKRITGEHCARHAKMASVLAVRRSRRDHLKNLARKKAFYAIKSGALKRGLCHCGKLGEAHHEDYSKPFQIVWLCPKHHKELHGQKHWSDREWRK